MITSSSYLTKLNTNIPNARDTAPNSNLLGNSSVVELFISKYEPDVLTKCLGYALNKEFKSNFEVVSPATLETLKGSADSKWDDLLNGKEYQLGGKTYYWKGLMNGDESMIAYYVFHHFFKEDLDSYTGVGLVQEKGKGSNHVNPNKLYVDSYNWFYDWAVGTYFDCNTVEYGVKSLYQFIKDMNDLSVNTYPNWMPYRFPKLNTAGI